MVSDSLPNMWVVIPTYNRAADLIDCLGSLRKAGVDESRIIVVDNASQDDTVPLVQKTFPAVHLLAQETNLGASRASNVGFSYALDHHASHVLRLDSDTVVQPDFLEPLLATSLGDSRIGVVAPKIYYYDPPDEIWYAGADAHPFHFGATNTQRHQKDGPANLSKREVDYAWGAAMLITADALKITHGFDPDFFIYYEEIDLCLRVKKAGMQIIFVPDSIIWHKVGSSAHNAWTATHWNRSKMLLFRKHARNILHFAGLVIYAFGYALATHLKKRNTSGNRGPLPAALKGLWQGLTKKIDPSQKTPQ